MQSTDQETTVATATATDTNLIASPAAFMPEKFRVMNGEQQLDVMASARKMAESYGQLEARFRGGEAPPNAAEEYAVTLPDDLKGVLDASGLDQTKLTSFKEEARALGLSQAQFDGVLGRHLRLVPQIAEAVLKSAVDVVVHELETAWGKEYSKNLAGAMSAFKAFAAPGDRGRFDEMMRDPSIAYRVLARVAAEMGEGGGVMPNADAAGDGENIQALLTSEAAGNPKHPEHKATRAKIDAHYRQRYGAQAAYD